MNLENLKVGDKIDIFAEGFFEGKMKGKVESNKEEGIVILAEYEERSGNYRMVFLDKTSMRFSENTLLVRISLAELEKGMILSFPHEGSYKGVEK